MVVNNKVNAGIALSPILLLLLSSTGSKALQADVKVNAAQTDKDVRCTLLAAFKHMHLGY